MQEAVKSKIYLLIDNLLSTKDTTGEFTQKLADGRVVDTKSWNVWDWQQGVGIYGVWKFYQKTGDERSLRVVKEWYESNLDSQPPKNINTACHILTLAYLYETTREKAHLNVIKEWTEFIMNELPRTESGCFQHTTSRNQNYQQIWDDTLFMTVLALAKAGILLKKSELVEEAKLQFLLHITYLLDNESSLFFHGWTFKDKNHFGAVKWARGNCWITLGIPELLNLLQLPKIDAFKLYLVNILERQVTELAKLQDSKTGMFYTVLDAPDDVGNYIEASATAGFAAGILQALGMNLISSEKYQKTADAAYNAVFERVLPDGKLKDTSFGTKVGNSKRFYYDIPLTDMPYGQALAIICLLEKIQ